MRFSALLPRISMAPVTTVLLLFGIACNSKTESPAETASPPPHLLPGLLQIIPHDSSSFTQGLFYRQGKLYESTGRYGKSTIRILDTTGAVQLVRQLSSNLFGEGCALLNDFCYQITWRRQLCFVYSPNELSPVDTLTYTGEGWGLAENDTLLMMSNGSDTIYLRDHRFQVVRKLAVTSGGTPLERLNELEYARGRIYANVWYSDYIFEINPENGSVERIFDCSELVARESPASDEQVLNGIAYNPDDDRFYLTGKNWKNIFVVTLIGGSR